MKLTMESNTASLVVIGVDIGKEVFHLVGLDADGKIAFRRRIRRLALQNKGAVGEGVGIGRRERCDQGCSP